MANTIMYCIHNIETNNRISRFALADPEKPVQPLHGYGLLDRPASSTGIQVSLLHTKIRKGSMKSNDPPNDPRNYTLPKVGGPCTRKIQWNSKIQAGRNNGPTLLKFYCV